MYNSKQIASAIYCKAADWAAFFRVTDEAEIEGRRAVMRANVAVGYLDPLLPYLAHDDNAPQVDAQYRDWLGQTWLRTIGRVPARLPWTAPVVTEIYPAAAGRRPSTATPRQAASQCSSSHESIAGGRAMKADDSTTIHDVIEFLRELAADTCSVLKTDAQTIANTLAGAPDRLHDLAQRIYKGRGHLRDLDEIFTAAESKLIAMVEQTGD
jgi:hypothetical protein